MDNVEGYVGAVVDVGMDAVDGYDGAVGATGDRGTYSIVDEAPISAFIVRTPGREERNTDEAEGRCGGDVGPIDDEGTCGDEEGRYGGGDEAEGAAPTLKEGGEESGGMATMATSLADGADGADGARF